MKIVQPAYQAKFDNASFQLTGVDEGDLDEESENGSNDTLDLEGALTIKSSVGSTEESDMAFL